MFNRDEIRDEIARVQQEGATFWGAFDTTTFFAKLGDAWSPSDNVRHLIKSIRPVTKALSTPRILLRVMFGTTRRQSSAYEEVRDRYIAIPEKQAGAFAPSSHQEADLDAWRTSLLHQLEAVNRELAAAAAKWSERDLDHYQLPHPLLGKLTMREMLFFTIHHQRHHIAGVKRRRG